MSAVKFNHYVASFEHKSYGGVTTTTIDYSADNVPAAARDAMRFYTSRQKLFPDSFQMLYCITIYGRILGGVEESGALGTRNTLPFFEWKIDGGYTYEQAVERAERWLERSNEPGVI